MTPFVRRLFILVIALLLLAGGAIVALRYFGRKQAEAPAPTNAPAAGGLPAARSAPAQLPSASATVTQPTNAPAAPTGPTIPEASEEQKLLNALVVTARDFAERYGSYSTQGDYANLEAVLPLMTDAYRTKTEADIAKGRATPPAAAYVGVTTKALSAKPDGTPSKTDPVTATVLTQRTTTKDGVSTVSYQTLDLTLRYEGAAWKVSAASWEKS